MKNREFYEKEIFEIACNGNSVGIVNGEPVACGSIACGKCDVDMNHECEDYVKEWMEKEHEEPRIQPEVKTLKQDDRVLVSTNGEDWVKRYFKEYDQEEGVVYAYINGATSWSAGGYNQWKYAKLPEDELEEEPETDWSKVPVDTKILVKEYEDQEWKERYLAKYENGSVYAWFNGKKSNETEAHCMWNYAKLADEELEVDWGSLLSGLSLNCIGDIDIEIKKDRISFLKDGKEFAWVSAENEK